MTDIVERLREWATHYNRSGVSEHFKEAADEIERLRLYAEEREKLIGIADRLQTQNAELLAALEEIANGWNMTVGGCKDMARAAIEKVKTNAVS